MIFLLVPAWIAGGIAAIWILTRRQWSWWVRIPGCIVLVPIAAWVGWVIFAAVMVAVLQVAAWVEDGTIPWP